jgi:glucose/arabinose dehydrogenase
MRIFTGFIAALASALVFGQQAAPALPVNTVKLPSGFHISVFATGVKSAREMALGSKGTVFVGSNNGTAIHALIDSNGNGKADRVVNITRGLKSPASGVAFHNGSLYVAEIPRMLRYDNIEAHLDNPPEPAVVYDNFPTETHHGWKFIAFGPDGMLYVPVGAPCNVCEPDARHGVLFRMKPDGTGVETFAKGIRNTVGFDWHPVNKELWFTDNGRDNLGDDVPPDELNHAPRAGMNFGFPYCHAGDISDPEFGSKHGCSEFTPPAQKLGPHVASIGMRFYTGKMFPDEYRNAIFIAEHGSWNRTKRIGYRVTVVKLGADGKVTSYTPFAQGWLQPDEKVWGRPSDVLVMPDGSLLVADDFANAVYRITYDGK